MNVLLVTWDAGGNVPPFLGLGLELVSRGHRVRCLGSSGMKAAFEQVGVQFAPTRQATDFEPLSPLTINGSNQLMARVWFDEGFMEDFRSECAAEHPDVVVIDCCLSAVQVLAEHLGLKTVILVHTLIAAPLHQWNQVFLPPINALRKTFQLPPVASVEAFWSRFQAVLVASTPSLGETPAAELLPNIRYSGPIFEPNGQKKDKGVRPRVGTPLVLASFSTTFMEQEQPLANVIRAIASIDAAGLVTTGPSIDPDRLPRFPNVSVKRWVVHAEVFPEVSVAVVHGGHSTVTKALAYGIPLLCMPFARDQDYVSGRVAQTGAGLCLPNTSTPPAMAAAITELLENKAYAERALFFSREIEALGSGPKNAAAIVEEALQGQDRLSRG